MRIPYRNKLLIKKILRILGITLVASALFLLVVVIYADSKVVYDRSGAHLSNEIPSTAVSPDAATPSENITPPEIIYVEKTEEDPTLTQMGGYFITTSMLQSPDKVLQQLKTIKEPCAVLIELKSIFGNFYYSTSIGDAKTATVDIDTIDQIISYVKANGFYMIASGSAFSDSNFALANQSCGLPLKNGALWMDENGCYWLDPASDTVLSYLTQIVRELGTLGFREVCFSDFRFPESNNIHYESDQTSIELIQQSAQQLTNFFKGSNITISYCVNDTNFPAQACNGRLYIEDVDGSKIERFTQVYASAQNLTELVFLANSRDTRFDELAVLRPLLSQ